MRIVKRFLIVIVSVILLLTAVFPVGRYSWKLRGFRACESAGIEQVTVEENQVHIRGFYPGSFPQGFLGYYAEQVDDTLYVGFKFSGFLKFSKPVILILRYQRKASLRKQWSEVENTNVQFG